MSEIIYQKRMQDSSTHCEVLLLSYLKDRCSLERIFFYCFEAVGSERKENIMLSYQEQHSFSFESRSRIQLCSQFPSNFSNAHHTGCFRPLKGLILVAPLNTLTSGLALSFFYFSF